LVTFDKAATEEGFDFAPIPVLRPRQQVEEQIRAAILTGKLQIGSKLPSEATLAQEFSVSRTTIREALRALATQGLIDKVPGAGGGSFVRSVDHRSLGFVLREGIENLLQLGTIETSEAGHVRQLLEVPAVRLAAQNRTPGELEKMEEIIERESSATVDDPDVSSLDVQFHSTIAQASGNRVLWCLIFALHRASEPVSNLDLSPEVGKDTVRQHRQILKGIRDEDPDAAESAIVTHLSYLQAHERMATLDAHRH